MDYLVTGIAPTANAAQIAELLESAHLDQTRLATVTKASVQTQTAQQHGGGASLSTASTIMTGSSGTGVPGMGGSHASLSSFSGHSAVPDYLGGLPLIPPEQAQHFNVAISEGRALVTYKATPEEAPNVEAAFRGAGLRNVKVFNETTRVTLRCIVCKENNG